MAFKDAVVKYQVYKKVFIAYQNFLLSGVEAESVTHFHHKIL